MKVILNGNTLSISDVIKVSRQNAFVELDKAAESKIQASRDMVEEVVKNKRTVYGITTGFGKFANVTISENDCKQLQTNLIISHACGVGQPFDAEIVRAMMLLRVNALSSGNSGISLKTLNLLIDMLNKGIVPVVPQKGSLGASGDLAPLAHMTLPLLGLGEVFYKGEKQDSLAAFKKTGLTPVELTAKEGLALINGTQAMCAIASLALNDALNLVKCADIISCLTIEALNGIIDAYDERIHKIRKQTGQIEVASNLRRILSGSQRITRQGEIRVQDAYTLRCIPQIHGASKDSIKYVNEIVSRELNAVTDNPLIFAETNEAISGGNFHGQYLAMAMDFLGIAVSELANVSERRTERLVNPQLSNLPAFLVKNGGLNSGFMIPQYVAAALVSENKVLAHPACVDSITSSANQEDHVSMGMTAARKAREIIENVSGVLGIELFAATQAIELSGGKNCSAATKAVFDLVRKEVGFVENDKYLSPEINKCINIVKSGKIVEVVENIIDKLN